MKPEGESLSLSKSKLKSGLFDSGSEEEDAEEVSKEKDEELINMADSFDDDVLEQFMDKINSQLSSFEKHDDTLLKVLFEGAFKKTKETVTKLMEAKKEKKLKEIEDDGDDEDKSTSKETSTTREESKTDDGGLNQEDNYQEQPPDESPTGDEVAGTTKVEEGKEESSLEGIDKRLLVKEKAKKAKSQEADDVVSDSHDEEDLEVEDEEEEELDKAALNELGDKITDEIQKKLSDAGIGEDGK